ncbi:protein translocase subunit SecD [Nonomuraea sp. KC401]|uniref:protein translocase subunit SecD n=1 Tax=unclassified Nonomuraea TaxID=2593643 RepID=UPI0010FCDDBA|nr:MULTISPECIES: protein translocase subunit SecD [unclassified Nonomuraea]NBE98460.1 protein translocase subunit SecD [Nonomuraea sp. K271]TLF60959.1 protein translocase subunit SecD [Nonomuraea sp. KC401]
MFRAPFWRAVTALAVIAISSALALTMEPRLGLDLRGGTQLVFEARDSPTVKADAAATDRALSVLRQRADALGVVDPTLVRSGEKRIIVELPGVLDPRKAAEVIGRTAQLAFHPVTGAAKKGDKSALPDENGQLLKLGPPAITGDGVSDAAEQSDPQRGPGWFVTLSFRDAAAWQKLTGAAACEPVGDPKRRVAIVLDKEIISSPPLDPSVACQAGIPGGKSEITGSFTHQEARDLAVLIKGGALPVPLAMVEQRTVGPTLGEAAIEASAQAAIVGLILTAGFIISVYRLSGLLSTMALVCYGLISYAALVAMGATLTLPGLAGFVLAIGMAIDANVLVFERAREEYGQAPKRGLKPAMAKGFKNAWSAIADSNITTLIAAGLLFWLASGPVKGFGVTLAVGVLASLVSAMLITRVLTEIAMNKMSPRLSGVGSPGTVRTWLARKNPQLMKAGKVWLAVAGGLVLVAVAGLLVRGLNFGVEFTGGRLVEFTTNRPIPAEAASEAVSRAGLPTAVVQSSGDTVTVRAAELGLNEAAQIEQELEREAGEVTKQREEFIGPSLGEELRRNALIALGVAVAMQLLYLAVRFRWTFGAATVIALLVDVFVVAGLFAWLGKPIDGVFLAAMLTIVGYSVNDKVVVFDRVRELWTARRKEPFATSVNGAILQTMPRTVNTGLGALFILMALMVFGGDSLQDFAIALVAGIVMGTLSSSFVAGPASIVLSRFDRRPPPEPAKRRAPEVRKGSGAVV